MRNNGAAKVVGSVIILNNKIGGKDNRAVFKFFFHRGEKDHQDFQGDRGEGVGIGSLKVFKRERTWERERIWERERACTPFLGGIELLLRI